MQGSFLVGVIENAPVFVWCSLVEGFHGAGLFLCEG